MTRSNHVANGRVARQARQTSAAKRVQERAERTTKQQLALIKKRPGSSAREVARLKAQL